MQRSAAAHPDALDRLLAGAPAPGEVIVPGFHAVKHAARFGAHVITAAATAGDRSRLDALAAELAPDLRPWLSEHVQRLPAATALPHADDVVALARRPAPGAMNDEAPVVLLDHPRHLGNLGAAIRVAAAAGAAGVLTLGDADPWHPLAVRGAAGLQFALPTRRTTLAELDAALARTQRPLIALDPAGTPLTDPATDLPRRAVLAFGAERHGLSAAVRERARRSVALPMRPGVSSLNLATSVAAVLYAQRLAALTSRDPASAS